MTRGETLEIMCVDDEVVRAALALVVRAPSGPNWRRWCERTK